MSNIKITKKVENKIIKLYKKGLSIKEISKKLNLSFYGVQSHLLKQKIKMRPRGKRKTILKSARLLTSEKAYILGVVGPGDGFIEFNKNSQQICLEAIDKDFIDYFAKCLEKVYGIKPSVKLLKKRPGDKARHFKVRLYSIAACEDLLSYRVKFNEANWEVPKEIKNTSEKIKLMYLKGMYDSQGSVIHSNYTRFVDLASNNKKGLEDIQQLLKSLGIVDLGKHKHGIRVTSRRSMLRFKEKVGFTIMRKNLALLNLLKSYKIWKTPEKEMQTIAPKIFLLHNKNMKAKNISKKLGINESTVYNYLRKIQESHSDEQLEFLGLGE